MVNVQFSNKEKTEIISIFGSQQDTNSCENQGEVNEDDPRLRIFLNSLPDNVVAFFGFE